MLVLSRRLNEKIIFPGIDTSVQIVSVKPGVVRLGIDAPDSVAVFREEVWKRDGQPRRGSLLSAETDKRLRELNHLVRNQVNSAGIGLDLLRRQLQAGMLAPAQRTLSTIEEEITRLRDGFQQAVTPPPAPAAPGKKSLKALLAEDNHNERELFAGLLRMAGLDVETANDGEDVLEYLGNQGRPDVLLLDMQLPRRDGPSTVKVIRTNPSLAGLKIFAVSGHQPDFFGLDEKNAGVDRWFLKPINPEAMLREISQELTARA